MKPEELRIGNLFTTFIPLVGSWAEKQRFDEEIYQARFCTFKDEETFKHFCGVPITEEWLLRFGFKKIDFKHNDGTISEGIYENYPIIIEKSKLEEDDYLFCRKNASPTNQYHYVTAIQDLHQLQNLYYDIIGSVLAVAPKRKN